MTYPAYDKITHDICWSIRVTRALQVQIECALLVSPKDLPCFLFPLSILYVLLVVGWLHMPAQKQFEDYASFLCQLLPQTSVPRFYVFKLYYSTWCQFHLLEDVDG